MRERRGRAQYPREVFIDSSGFFALAYEKERHHQRAVATFTALYQARSQMVLTNFIRAETHALILNRLGHQFADRFLAQVSQSPPSSHVRVTEQDEEDAIALIARYKDKDFSLTDATSFVVMERRSITRAISYDDHFRQYGIILLG